MKFDRVASIMFNNSDGYTPKINVSATNGTMVINSRPFISFRWPSQRGLKGPRKTSLRTFRKKSRGDHNAQNG